MGSPRGGAGPIRTGSSAGLSVTRVVPGSAHPDGQHPAGHVAPRRKAVIVTGRKRLRRTLVIACCAMLTVTGCTFGGLNSLPLPGAVGRGPGAEVYHVESRECRHAGIEFAGTDQ